MSNVEELLYREYISMEIKMSSSKEAPSFRCERCLYNLVINGRNGNNSD